jgi:N-succinyldiaminopimelate aminotransferase
MSSSGLTQLSDGSILSPFSRLRALLADVAPGHARPIDLTLGEPRETMPPFVAERIAAKAAEFAKYPPIKGSDELRSAIADWVGRRYGAQAAVDPAREVLPCNGSREGLFYACFPAVGRKTVSGQPAVLLCNPFYQAYFGAALAAGCEPVFLNATTASGHLPDLDGLAANEELLKRTVCFYLCSPANPQGAVASKAYLLRALEIARTYNFMLFLDECYSEIYAAEPPPGGLEVAAGTPDRFRNLVVFNSLSKRSNLPGLRSGFCAGDATFLSTLFEVRNLVGPQMPGPTQHASAHVWADEVHVEANRQAYRAKFDVCDDVLGDRFGYRRPAGGFFLWLDMHHIGGGTDAAITLWKQFGVKVIPGSYLAQRGYDGINPGASYVRIALVHDIATIREALERLVHVSA